MIKLNMFSLLLIGLAIRAIDGKNADDLLPIDKRDEVLAYLFNYGDKDFKYPSIMKLSKACNLNINNQFKDLMEDLLSMVDEHYQNPIVYKVAELMFSKPLIEDDDCKKATGPGMRAGTNQIQKMNEHRFKAQTYRELFELILSDAAHPDTKYDIPTIACFLEFWMEKTIEKYPTKDGVQLRVEVHIHKVFDPVIKYLRTLSLDNIKECNFRAVPREGIRPRFKSIQLNLLEAIDNLTARQRKEAVSYKLESVIPPDDVQAVDSVRSFSGQLEDDEPSEINHEHSRNLLFDK